MMEGFAVRCFWLLLYQFVVFLGNVEDVLDHVRIELWLDILV